MKIKDVIRMLQCVRYINIGDYTFAHYDYDTTINEIGYLADDECIRIRLDSHNTVTLVTAEPPVLIF